METTRRDAEVIVSLAVRHCPRDDLIIWGPGDDDRDARESQLPVEGRRGPGDISLARCGSAVSDRGYRDRHEHAHHEDRHQVGAGDTTRVWKCHDDAVR